MFYKILIFSTGMFLTLSIGCSKLDKLIYHPDINQGNYLTHNDLSKIHIGITQKQVIHALGTPMMVDPFGSNTWFYVFRQQTGHKKIKQQTLILIFNNKGILISIDNKFI